jgi:hypothetical protein
MYCIAELAPEALALVTMAYNSSVRGLPPLLYRIAELAPEARTLATLAHDSGFRVCSSIRGEGEGPARERQYWCV